MTSTQLGRPGAHRPAIRSEPRHRRRGARRAGGDQRGARRPADQPAQQPDLSQGQSGRCADPDPGADLEDADARPDVRRRQQRAAAAAVADRRRRPGDHRRLRRCRRCASSSIRRRCSNTASGWRTCAPRSPRPTPTARRARSRTASGTSRSTPTTRRARPTDYRPLVIAYRNGARGAAVGCGRRVRIRSRTCATSGLANGKPAVLVILFRQPGANIIDTVDRVKAALPQLEAAMPQRHRRRSSPIDRSTTIRASLQRHRAHAADRGRPGDAGRLPVPAQSCARR